MQKINWENGIVTKDAYVTIDGTEYSVTPEEYEGNTPLSAENLNLMQDNIELGINELKTQKILWQGVFGMAEGHTVNLTEPISNQNNGIVLVWSRYLNGAATNADFYCYYIPKMFVALHDGSGHSMTLADSNGVAAHKYVYVYNQRITGNSSNTGNNTSRGVSYQNSNYVLRYVIGV